MQNIFRKIILIFSLICVRFNIASGQSLTYQQPLIDTGVIPKVFAPGIISTPYTEWSTSFSPDERTVYSSQGAIYWTIIFSKMINGQWTKPQVANFSGRFRDTDPFISPDGKRIFFISSRPLESGPQDKPQRVMHVWFADLVNGDTWGKPHHLDSTINLNGVNNYSPSVSMYGTLFYCSRRKDLNGMQTFYSTWSDDHYNTPKQLAINGVSEIQDPFIAPDESFLIFLSGNDIYISFKQNNLWSAAENLGPVVNNGDGNSSPCVSRDGEMLYYTSPRFVGFYKRDPKNHAVDYDELVKENGGLFNNQPNILMIPIHLPVKKERKL